MNQANIGAYIAKKRKDKNLTQEQLAEKLGVSNKTISKWENGKCMPDYSVIEKLCDELSVTLAELMDGEDAAESSVRVYDDAQLLDLLRRTQELENSRGVLLRRHSYRARYRLLCNIRQYRRIACERFFLRTSAGDFRRGNARGNHRRHEESFKKIMCIEKISSPRGDFFVVLAYAKIGQFPCLGDADTHASHMCQFPRRPAMVGEFFLLSRFSLTKSAAKVI